MYSEDEDDRDRDEFLYHFCMKNRSVDEYNEKEVEGNVPTSTNHKVIADDKGPKRNVNIGPLLTDNDFDEFFAADLVDIELFSEPEYDEYIVSDKIEVGLQFPDKAVFQKFHIKYCVSNRIIYKLRKSENVRIKAVCQGFGKPVMCPWFVSARKIPGEPTWSIRKCHLHHSCVGHPNGRNPSANHEFVAEHLMKKMKKTHSKTVPKPSEIFDEFWMSRNTLIPYHVVWKARNIVLEKLNGSYDESFKLIPSLCEMITRTNPKSIATCTYNMYIFNLRNFLPSCSLCSTTNIHSSIFTIDLDRKTCSCVQWQLRGFPCQHAVCVPQQVRPNWVQYCARYYSVDNYKITYASGMVPLEGPPDGEEPRATIVSPLLIKKSGRTRKNRRKAYDETLPEKKPTCCSKCKQPGHNKTTCGGPVGSNTKRKRIRAEVEG